MIKRISFSQEEDQVNFLETYLAGNQQVTLSNLQAAFSAIEELTIYDYCRNSLLFAATQFNNLRNVKIIINVVEQWEEPHTLFFYEHAFALLNNARNGGRIRYIIDYHSIICASNRCKDCCTLSLSML